MGHERKAELRNPLYSNSLALASGTRLGPYEIAALLGVGGMGEVCQARDTKLDRDVAIKVLPASHASRTISSD